MVGILFLTNLIAFSLYTSQYSEDPGAFAKAYNPNEYFYEKLTCCKIITAFSSVAVMSSFIAIFIIGCTVMEHPTSILVFSLIAAFFTLTNFITLGVYYDYSVKDSTAKELNIIRNSSSASSYIRKSLKKMYKQAIENFGQNAETSKCSIEPWDDVEERIGKSITTESGRKFVTWSHFFEPYSHNGSIYFHKRTVDKNNATIIEAILSCDGENYSIPIASLSFNITRPKLVYRSDYFCTNKTYFDLKCKKIESANESDIHNIIDFSSVFSITQRIIKWPKGQIQYYTNSQILNNSYDLNYEITFPSGFHLISYSEYMSAEKQLQSIYATGYMNAYFYDKSSYHYRVDPIKYLKYKYKIYNDDAQRKGESFGSRFYFCLSGIPSTYSSISRCYGPYDLSYNYFLDYVYPQAKDQDNAGYIPLFIKRHNRFLAKQKIFDVLTDFLPQLSIILMCTQIITFVLTLLSAMSFYVLDEEADHRETSGMDLRE